MAEVKETVTQSVPSITWYPERHAFQITLMGVDMKKIDASNEGVRLDLPMPVLYHIQVRKTGDEDWIFGVILPFSGVEITGMESGGEYEIQTTPLSHDKKPISEPVSQRMKAE